MLPALAMAGSRGRAGHPAKAGIRAADVGDQPREGAGVGVQLHHPGVHDVGAWCADVASGDHGRVGRTVRRQVGGHGGLEEWDADMNF